MAPKLKRAMYHAEPKGPTRGKDVQIAKWGVHNYETNLLPKPVTGFTPDFGPALYDALHKVIQPNEGINPTGDIGQATWDVLWEYIPRWKRAEYLAWKIPTIPKPNPVPWLGPVIVGDPPLSKLSLTHNTDGMPSGQSYIAVDVGWIQGRTILAPEDLVVTKQSSAAGADAFYASGSSTLLYWFGHLQYAPKTGTRFKRGQVMGRIAWIPSSDGGPHLHVGIDGRPLLGHPFAYGRTGKGPDYTFGSPSIDAQLREALSL